VFAIFKSSIRPKSNPGISSSPVKSSSFSVVSDFLLYRISSLIFENSSNVINAVSPLYSIPFVILALSLSF